MFAIDAIEFCHYLSLFCGTAHGSGYWPESARGLTYSEIMNSNQAIA
jgi:hypothetical protein